jgi:uncharacterized protein (TIGR00106 family)
MQVVADLCIVPVGTESSVSRYIKACEQVLEEAGLVRRVHAYGTNIEGDWDSVVAAVKRCHERVHELGAPRISTTLKLGTRTDKPSQGIQQKIEAVENLPPLT